MKMGTSIKVGDRVIDSLELCCEWVRSVSGELIESLHQVWMRYIKVILMDYYNIIGQSLTLQKSMTWT